MNSYIHDVAIICNLFRFWKKCLYKR